MNTNEKIIIENFGEKMWKLCKELFPEYLNNKRREGEVGKIMLDHFHPSIRLSMYDDIIAEHREDKFKNLMVKLIKKPNLELLAGIDWTLYCWEIYDNKFWRISLCRYRCGKVLTGNCFFKNGEFVDKYSKDPKRYIVFDAFLMDLQERKISFLFEDSFNDPFVNEFRGDDGKSIIENIVVDLNDKTGDRTIEITYDKGKKATIVVDKINRMIEYHNHNLLKLSSGFLGVVKGDTNLRVLDTPNVTEIDDELYRLERFKSLTTFNVSTRARLQLQRKRMDILLGNLSYLLSEGCWCIKDAYDDIKSYFESRRGR